MSMRRATPLEQVQTVPLTLHAQGQVGCLVECSHRKGTERGLLPAFSTFYSFVDLKIIIDVITQAIAPQ